VWVRKMCDTDTQLSHSNRSAATQAREGRTRTVHESQMPTVGTTSSPGGSM